MGSGTRSRRSFAAMMHMVHYGGLRGVVGRTFDLADAAKAHEVMAGRDSSASWSCACRRRDGHG